MPCATSTGIGDGGSGPMTRTGCRVGLAGAAGGGGGRLGGGGGGVASSHSCFLRFIASERWITVPTPGTGRVTVVVATVTAFVLVVVVVTSFRYSRTHRSSIAGAAGLYSSMSAFNSARIVSSILRIPKLFVPGRLRCRILLLLLADLCLFNRPWCHLPRRFCRGR